MTTSIQTDALLATFSDLAVKNITGGAGNDTLTGDSQNNWLAGDERGVDGTDVAQCSGSFVDHHIIKVRDTKGMNTLAVSLLFTSRHHAANNQNWSKRA